MNGSLFEFSSVCKRTLLLEENFHHQITNWMKFPEFSWRVAYELSKGFDGLNGFVSFDLIESEEDADSLCSVFSELPIEPRKKTLIVR